MIKLPLKGATADPLVEKYLNALIASDEFIMIFPILWGMIPAIVKGCFDKVMQSIPIFRGRQFGS